MIVAPLPLARHIFSGSDPMRLRLLCLAPIAVLALASARAAEPTVEQDLNALKGKWVSPEATFKRGKTTVAVQMTAEFREKGEGTLTVGQSYAPPFEPLNDGAGYTGGSRAGGFKYAIEEKDGKRTLRLSGAAFQRSTEGPEKVKEFPALTAYRLKADEVELGAVKIMVYPLVAGLEPAEEVEIKGTWKRATEKK
jgi:hypothetical protein